MENYSEQILALPSGKTFLRTLQYALSFLIKGESEGTTVVYVSLGIE